MREFLIELVRGYGLAFGIVGVGLMIAAVAARVFKITLWPFY
jgi:hypothetical protein